MSDIVELGFAHGTLRGPRAALGEALRALRVDPSFADAPLPCLCTLAAQLERRPPTEDASGSPSSTLPMLEEKMHALEDSEGARLPDALHDVVDAHVHLFPDKMFEALWRWFEAYAWPIRYQMRSPEIIRFLTSRGVSSLVALHYSHRPDMARALNAYMAEICAADSRVVGLATVFPGEAGATEILEEAFAAGRQGVKLHCHVQGFSPDDDKLEEVYAACIRADRPLVMHAGREPKSAAYPADPHALCSASRTEEVLRSFPKLRLLVPHLGADEFDAYRRLLTTYDNLWVDTTMMAANYFPTQDASDAFVATRPERVLYGTDFPNLPYAWDREARRLCAKNLSAGDRNKLFSENARSLFGIRESQSQTAPLR